MAKLEAVISADITPFDKALNEAAEKAKGFGIKLGQIGSDFAKSFSGIDISAALGIAGGVVGLGALTEATEKFAAAAVNAAKQGYEAFEKYQRSVLQLKYALPAAMPAPARATEAREIAGIAGSKAGIFGGEEMRTAARIMMQASNKFAESPDKLSHVLDALKDVAFAQGSNITEVATSFKNLLVGAKEGREGGARAISSFFKENTALIPQAEEFRAEYEKAHPGRISESMKTMDIGQFMSTVSGQIGLPAMIAQIQAMLPKAAPGAAREAELEEPGLKLAKTFAGIQKAFGEQLKPAMDEFIHAMIAYMPVVRDLFMGLAEVMKVVIPAMGVLMAIVAGLTMAFNTAVKAVATFIDRVSFGAFSGMSAALAGQEQANKTADEVNAKLASLGTEADKTGENVSELGNKSAEVTAAYKEVVAIELDAFKLHAKAQEEDVKALHTHAAALNKVALEATQFELKTAAATAAKRAIIDRPRGATELEDKQLAAQSEADAKSINARAAAAEKINAANAAAEERIAAIEETIQTRKIARQVEDREIADKQAEINADQQATADEKKSLEAALQDEIDARDAVRNEEDMAAAMAIGDTKEERAEKIREADIDAANAIIDAQEAASDKMIDAQKSAALAALDKMVGPFKKEEAPAGRETFSKFGKGGEVIEGSADKKARDERNAAAEESNRQWKEMQRMAIEHEFAEKKRVIEDQLERQRPTEIGLKRTHVLQQEQHVKAIEAEKGRTEADQDFAKAHKALGLPSEPAKEPTGKGDVSIRTVSEILTKIWDSINIGNSHFEQVFKPSG